MADSPSPSIHAPVPELHNPLPRRPSLAGRAQIPPPIFIRKATEPDVKQHLHSLHNRDSGVDITIEASEASEASDGVPELTEVLKSPSRAFMLNVDRPPSLAEPAPGSPARPVSPSWQSMEVQASESPNASPVRLADRPLSWRNSMERPASWRNSLEVPNFGSPISPQNDQRSSNHYRTHSRNLSAYFPHPGMPARPSSPTPEAGESVIPDESARFGSVADYRQDGEEPIPRGKRRGHHHRHSLSHNFFSFLDPTQTNPAMDEASPTEVKPRPMSMTFNTAPETLAPIPKKRRDPHDQLLLSFAIVEAVLGAGIWIEGQISGWRALSAMGYLVVFDALGVGINMFTRAENNDWNNLRRPYGSSRLTSLLCFSQSVFLVFSATYIAKEALEQVILGGHDHGHSHGSSSHSDPRSYPYLFLFLASLASLFSGVALRNHSKLADATGPLFLPSWYLAIPFVEANEFLQNPYTLAVSGTAAVLLLGGIVTPASALPHLDSAASLILTVLTASLAYRPTVAYAHVLLQTAPPSSSPQMKALRSALQSVAADKRVLGLGTLRIWAINAGKAETAEEPSIPSAPPSRRGSISTPSPSTAAFTDVKVDFDQDKSALAQHVPLVVTLVVHVHPESSDRDIFDVTRNAWNDVNGAVNTNRDSTVTIDVRRGWDGPE